MPAARSPKNRAAEGIGEKERGRETFLGFPAHLKFDGRVQSGSIYKMLF